MLLRKDVQYGAVGKDGLYVGETAKAHERRLREGWFDVYAPVNKPGIDIGCGVDPLNNAFHRWDHIYGDPDAAYMDGIPDESFFTVYASHILEHLEEPVEAVSNWWRILQFGGHLIVVVPHRDLYELQTTLPSRWNGDHKWFWMPEVDEPPSTLSLQRVILEATGRTAGIRILRDGYQAHPDKQPTGEYSIEAIVGK